MLCQNQTWCKWKSYAKPIKGKKELNRNLWFEPKTTDKWKESKQNLPPSVFNVEPKTTVSGHWEEKQTFYHHQYSVNKKKILKNFKKYFIVKPKLRSLDKGTKSIHFTAISTVLYLMLNQKLWSLDKGTKSRNLSAVRIVYVEFSAWLAAGGEKKVVYTQSLMQLMHDFLRAWAVRKIYCKEAQPHKSMYCKRNFYIRENFIFFFDNLDGWYLSRHIVQYEISHPLYTHGLGLAYNFI
jgi:hypothetical protein